MKIAAKTLTLVLALVLLTTPLMASKLPLVHAAAINYEVQPFTNTAPATNITNWDMTILNTATVGQTFNVSVHLTGATVANAPSGVAGIEVHLDFTQILPYASIVGFTDYVGPTSPGGGVLNSPILEAITGAIYLSDGSTIAPGPLFTGGVQYIVSAASTGAGWNGADGLVVQIEFRITSLPDTLHFPSDPVIPCSLTFTDLSAGGAPWGTQDGTVTFQRITFTYPVNPVITIAPASQTGAATLGAPVNYVVSLTADKFWDIAGFDVTVTWNSTLLSYVGYTIGTWLTMHGDPTFDFNVTSGTPINSIEIVATKLGDSLASSGTAPLFTLNLAVNYIGSTYPALTCPIALGPTDLAAWAHPEIAIAPFFNSITGVDIPYSATVVLATHQRGADASYIAPVLTAGAGIDLYDQYPYPYGGQGHNFASDSFAPQAEVCLYANVTYGGDRVSNKLVVFEIDNALGQKVTILQNYSDANGVASVCFRLPMSDYLIGGNGTGTWDPAIFGTWVATATVEIDQVQVNDTMPFLVGWLVQVTSVTSNSPSYLKYAGNPMNFTATVLTIHEQPLNVLISIDTYDVQGYPIGETTFWVTLSAAADANHGVIPTYTTYGVLPNSTYYGWSSLPYTMYQPYQVDPIPAGSFILQGIPSWTRVGLASVIGYALTGLPSMGGTAYGPQSNADGTTTTFPITLH